VDHEHQNWMKILVLDYAWSEHYGLGNSFLLIQLFWFACFQRKQKSTRKYGHDENINITVENLALCFSAF
jgi:hypothetical protein